MAANEVAYTLDNTWVKAHRRLTVLESVFDPWSIPRLSALGVDEGWRCLELGAGAGSITRRLCDRVGSTGNVVAVDLEPCFLEADPRPNLEIERHDIVADGIPGDGYDLIHTRALLMHLPTRDQLIGDLIGCLRPGGVILLEEADGYPFLAAESSLYVRLWEAACAVAAKAGGDWNWARFLPARLAAARSRRGHRGRRCRDRPRWDAVDGARRPHLRAADSTAGGRGDTARTDRRRHRRGLRSHPLVPHLRPGRCLGRRP